MSNYGKDYYRILQVHPDAEEEVIQAAYRRLARKYHPDIEDGDSARMQEINEAYEVLADFSERKRYDQWYRFRAWRAPSSTSTPSEARQTEKPVLSLWKVILPTVLLLGFLSIFVFDIFRLGIRGLPEVTLLLVVLGLLVYYFGGIRDLWH